MKLSPIVLILRTANISTFGERIAGAAEFSMIQEDTLEGDTAYVIQTDDTAIKNQTDGAVEQKLTERFGVVVAIRNDQSQADKTGLTAYDQLHEIRKSLWDALVGYNLDSVLNDDGYSVEGPIEYTGGSLMDINSAWLWYLYEFEYPARLQSLLRDYDLDNLNTIAAQWRITPAADIPYKGAGELPVLDNPDMESIIDLTESLIAGAFADGFDSGFDLYEG